MTVAYTKANIIKFQTDAKAQGHYAGAIDGLWGLKSEAAFIAMMKQTVYPTATFPYDDYKRVSIKMNYTMRSEYLPTAYVALKDKPLGLRLLCEIHAHIEGFRPGTKAYVTRNPGNIGNTDDGKTKTFETLADGIKAQSDYILKVAHGEHRAYTFGQQPPGLEQPFYSEEIARNRTNYGIPAQLPGYRFNYTGSLEEYVKIYATAPRVHNGYVNAIVSYFAQNSLPIAPDSKLQDIVKLT